jgi:hypothetical protein
MHQRHPDAFVLAIAGNTARADGKSGSAINPYGISVRQILFQAASQPVISKT